MEFKQEVKIEEIYDAEEFGANNFKVRKFVGEIENEQNPEWNQFRQFQLTQDRCDLIDAFSIGDKCVVHFNLRGRKYEKDGKVMYFNSDEAWRLEKVESAIPDIPDIRETAPEEDDVPF